MLAHKYDAASHRARIIHPDLAWFEYARDTLGRPYWLASSDNGWSRERFRFVGFRPVHPMLTTLG